VVYVWRGVAKIRVLEMGWVTGGRRDSAVEAYDHDAAERQPFTGGAPEPKDNYNIAYVVFFALGAGLLLPWNAFISAVDYFQVLYPGGHTDRVFAVGYMLPCFLTLIYLTFYCRLLPASSRINGGLALFLLAIVLMPIMDELFINKSSSRGSQVTHFLTIGAIVLTGIADAIVQGSLVGAAGELPERYMQALMAGTAGSGVLASILRVITKASLPQTVQGLRLSANVYFSVSAIFIGICIISYNLVYKLPIMVHYNKLKLNAMELFLQNGDDQEQAAAAEEDSKVGISDELQPEIANDQIVSLKKVAEPVSYRHVWSQIHWLASSIVVIYVVTLSIFPGYITEDVHSVRLGDWYPVLLILSYNIFDLVGKTLTAIYMIESQNTMVIGCFARLLFFPLFYLVLYGPEILRTEVPVFILTCLLGGTNGYFTSVLMIVAPKNVSMLEAETAGIVMVLFLVLGLLLGSLVSWFWII
jgi:equilibrative nucleoside transporter 1/2/3